MIDNLWLIIVVFSVLIAVLVVAAFIGKKPPPHELPEPPDINIFRGTAICGVCQDNKFCAIAKFEAGDGKSAHQHLLDVINNGKVDDCFVGGSVKSEDGTHEVKSGTVNNTLIGDRDAMGYDSGQRFLEQLGWCSENNLFAKGGIHRGIEYHLCAL